MKKRTLIRAAAVPAAALLIAALVFYKATGPKPFAAPYYNDPADTAPLPANETQTAALPAMWPGNPHGKNMTLADVKELAAKGEDLLFEDLQPFMGGNASSTLNYCIMVYSVAGGYRLVVHSAPAGKPDAVNLESIWESGGSGIDIRYGDVEEFLLEHRSKEALTEAQAQNIVQRSLGYKPEPVSWHILGDFPADATGDAALAEALLDSTYTLSEPCWLFRAKDAEGWVGRYYAAGKKSGAVFSADLDEQGQIDGWHKFE